jgi:5-carboxymethyl-2-hydroxymuconate isomerase
MSVDQKFLDMARDLANSRFPMSKFGAAAPVFEEESAATETPLVPGLDAYRTMARELTTKPNKPKRKLPFMDMAEEFVGNRAERLLRNYTRPSFYEQTETYAQERIGAVGALETPKVELRAPFTEAEFQGALYAIYRQIFGNTYVMESERPTVAESQLRNGELTVRGFVRALVKSEVYKTRFFQKASQNRAIELSHKLLLGRAPYDQAEIARHLNLYESHGYDAEMDSYLDSEEYLENFGEGTVPYFRGFKYQVGQTGPAFSRMLDLYDGYAGSDTDRAQIGQVARLTEDLSKLVKQEAPPPQPISLISPTSAYIRSQYALSPSLQAFRAKAALETPKVELRAPFSEAEFQGALYAIYRQIFGNTYVMESERPVIAESQLKNGELTVRGFIRCLVKSDVYKTRFFHKASQNRAIELSHKLLLGRAPYDQTEIAHHLDLYESQGYDAEMDSYLDSEEYLENFGEGTVPYYRGFKYQVGQTGPAFSRMLDLYDGYATSDSDRAQIGQVARLTEDLSKLVKQETPTPQKISGFYGIYGIAPTLSTGAAYIRSKYALPAIQIDSRIRAASETPKVELRAPFSEAELQGALYAIYKQVFGNTHVMESERPTFAESQLRNGQITVRGFISYLVKTEAYKTRFFAKASQNRAIELSHKFLLGRAPYDQTEISRHLDLYESQGYDAEMDSYLNSEEYLENFGENIVPYFRGFDYQVGQTGPAFSRMLDLYDGYATSDSDRAQIGQVARLTEDLSKLLKQENLAPQQTAEISRIAPTAGPSAAYTRPALPALQVGSRIRAASDRVELRAPFSEDELQRALYAIYEQVLGNTHVMESERPTFAESQLRDGKITVRGFIGYLVKTEAYKARFFAKASQNRFIELNFKLLLGRAPYSQQEISHHVALYNAHGYDAEVDSYLNSEEYLENFGENIVPYFRGFDTQKGQNTDAFNRMMRLYDGYAGSDTDRAQVGQVARLTEDLASLVRQEAPLTFRPSDTYISALQVDSRIRAASETSKVELRAPFSEAELQSALYAIYKQVFGNTHVMESERPTFAESQLRDGKITVRGFIGYLIKTEAYKTRFFSKASQNRFIELNFKLLLGRAPYSQQEISHHVALYNTHGYDAEMDSYLNSAEYLENFGEDIVPYYRGFETQKGQNTNAFNRMLDLYDGYATSDSDRAQIGQVARLTDNLAQAVY